MRLPVMRITMDKYKLLRQVRRLALIVFLAVLTGPVSAIAGAALGNLHYISWKLTDSSGERTVDQLASTLNTSFVLREDYEFLFSASGARTNLETGLAATDLSGAGDVRIHMNRHFFDNRVLLGVGLNLPTGKAGLDFGRDTSVINQLTQNYLIFPLRAYGAGMGVRAVAGYANKFGGSHQGSLSFTYEYLGPFEPYRTLGDYDPGDRFTVGVGTDMYFDFFNLSMDVNLSISGSDVYDGKKVFEQSARISGDLRGAYMFEPSRLDFAIGYLYRGRNTIYDSNGSVFEQLRLFGHEFFANVGLSREFSHSLSAGLNSEIRLLTSDENIGSDRVGKSNTFGIGGGVVSSLGGGLVLNVTSRWYTGSANDGLIDLSGLLVSLGLKQRF